MSCCLMTMGTMTINEIITNHYQELKSRCHNDYKVISLSRTSEDVLHDVCVTAIRKYKSKPVDEDEALTYLQRTLWFELKFQTNRVDPRIVVLDDLGKVDRAEDDN